MNENFFQIRQRLMVSIAGKAMELLMAQLAEEMSGQAEELRKMTSVVAYLCLADCEVRGTDKRQTLLFTLKRGDVIIIKDSNAYMMSHYPCHTLPLQILLHEDATVECLLPLHHDLEAAQRFLRIAATAIHQSMVHMHALSSV